LTSFAAISPELDWGRSLEVANVAYKAINLAPFAEARALIAAVRKKEKGLPASGSERREHEKRRATCRPKIVHEELRSIRLGSVYRRCQRILGADRKAYADRNLLGPEQGIQNCRKDVK
jgi:hypothetical protein